MRTLCVVDIPEGQHSGVLAVARVDVVAAAHIDAAESSQASGRYLCFERLLSDDEALELMKKLFPTLSHKRYADVSTHAHVHYQNHAIKPLVNF